jgi:hypothetical protein
VFDGSTARMGRASCAWGRGAGLVCLAWAFGGAAQAADWSWMNPLRQGNSLRGVWNSGPNDVFAVGAAGTNPSHPRDRTAAPRGIKFPMNNSHNHADTSSMEGAGSNQGCVDGHVEWKRPWQMQSQRFITSMEGHW